MKPIQSAPSSPVDDDDQDEDYTAYDSDEEDNAPDSYKCPISRLIMRRPVQLSDGHSYEKKEIKRWLKRSNKSPFTGDTTQFVQSFKMKCKRSEGLMVTLQLLLLLNLIRRLLRISGSFLL